MTRGTTQLIPSSVIRYSNTCSNTYSNTCSNTYGNTVKVRGERE